MEYPVTKQLTRMSTMLMEPHQARRWNCGLNLYVKVFLRKIDPDRGAATGTAADWNTRNLGGPRRKIIRWARGEFETWAARYQRECQAFWDNRFWLTPLTEYADLDFKQGKLTLRPAARCGLHLTLVSTESSADHTIDVVRLADDEAFYRSDSGHYDHRDIDSAVTPAGHQQRGHVHEVGHLLTLGHSNEGDPACVDNNNVCYANDNVMGGGEKLADWNAKPWQDAMHAVTGISAALWRVSQAEVLPTAK